MLRHSAESRSADGRALAGRGNVRETLLLVHRHRVVDLRPDLAFGQEGLEGVPPSAPDHAQRVLIPDVAVPGVRRRQDDLRRSGPPRRRRVRVAPRVGEARFRDARQRRELLRVVGGVAAPLLRVLGVVRELDGQERGLQRVEPKITADVLVEVLRLRAVRAEHPRAAREIVVVRDENAAVAEPAQILRREEAEHSERPHAADLPSLVRRAHGLRRVLDDRNPAIAREGHHGVHVGRLPEEMHGHDRLRPWRDLAGGVLDVHVEAVEAGVGEDRRRARARDAAGRGEEGEARADHLVARPDPQGHQREEDPVGARRDADRVLDARELGDLRFEVLDFRAEDELPGAQHALEGALELSLESQVLDVQVEQGNGHRFLSPFRRA